AHCTVPRCYSAAFATVHTFLPPVILFCLCCFLLSSCL
ncbi:hypothetical protein A2U01_0074519, partial [Trifolium medium]|nr:hypothetical protein [Trifolium medium]